MKKTILILVLFLIANIGLNWVRSLFEFDLTTDLAAKAAIKLGLVFFTFRAIINQHKTWTYTRANALWAVVCTVILALAYYRMDGLLQGTSAAGEHALNSLYLLSCLGTGFFEELLFRVFVFSALFYVAFNNKSTKKRYYLSLFWASLAFGLAHLPNALKAGTEYYGILNQVVFAFFIGLVFQGLLIRFKSIVLIGVLHGLVNYFGAYRTNLEIPREIPSGTFQEFLLNLLILTTIAALICVPITYALIRKELRTTQDTPL